MRRYSWTVATLAEWCDVPEARLIDWIEEGHVRATTGHSSHGGDPGKWVVSLIEGAVAKHLSNGKTPEEARAEVSGIYKRLEERNA